MRSTGRRSLLVALWAVACAATTPACSQPEPPLTSARRLEKARAADAAGDTASRDAYLRVLSAGADEEARVATTWLFQDAVGRQDVVAALPHLVRIVEVFGGRGLSKDGLEHLQDTLAPVLLEEAAMAARRYVEGPTPDVAKAKQAIEVARRAGTLGADEDDRKVGEAAAAYVALSDGPVDLSGLVPAAPPGAGPRVVAFADHFQLGEPVFPSVLKRWHRGLPVHLVGILGGSVREGIRRTPATPHMERVALEERAKELGLPLERAVAEHAEPIRRLGLDAKGATVFVLAADGTLLARASGRSLDPRTLDPVVTRLAPPPAPEK